MGFAHHQAAAVMIDLDHATDNLRIVGGPPTPHPRVGTWSLVWDNEAPSRLSRLASSSHMCATCTAATDKKAAANPRRLQRA